MRRLLMILILPGPLSAAFSANTVTGGLPKQAVSETAVTPGFFRSQTPLALCPGDDLPGGQQSFLW